MEDRKTQFNFHFAIEALVHTPLDLPRVWSPLFMKSHELRLPELFHEVRGNLLKYDSDQKRILHLKTFKRDMNRNEKRLLEYLERINSTTFPEKDEMVLRSFKENIKEKIDAWNVRISELEMDLGLVGHPSKTIQKPQRTKFYQTILTQKQTLLLAFLMKEGKIILPQTSNRFMAYTFGGLSGYSETQIEKDLKGVQDPTDITDNPEDYNQLISVLDQLIKKIEEGKPK